MWILGDSGIGIFFDFIAVDDPFDRTFPIDLVIIGLEGDIGELYPCVEVDDGAVFFIQFDFTPTDGIALLVVADVELAVF